MTFARSRPIYPGIFIDSMVMRIGDGMVANQSVCRSISSTPQGEWRIPGRCRGAKPAGVT